MVKSDLMETFVLNGKQISPGLMVKYTRTHTVGRIEEIKSENDAVWIKIDKSGLYYRSEYIEVVEGKDAYISREKPKRIKNKSEKFDIEIPVEISDTTNGPGVGGG